MCMAQKEVLVMTEISNNSISFRKLFDVKSYPEMHLSFFVAVSGSGELLYITEEVAGILMNKEE